MVTADGSSATALAQASSSMSGRSRNMEVDHGRHLAQDGHPLLDQRGQPGEDLGVEVGRPATGPGRRSATARMPR